ncbi:MAG: Cdc6/Cdc18 family protein [Thermoplasmataceae archaeon]
MSQSIIKNRKPLESSFIPPEIIHRKDELEKIERSVILPLKMGSSTNLLIHGDSGTGKTVTLKHIMLKHERLGIFYENAISAGNFKNILVSALRSMGKIMPDRGTSYSQIFRNIALTSDNRSVLIIIDECANAIRMDPNGLYNILRAGELFGVAVGTILVSVEDPLIYMSERERKTLGLFSGMKFPKYSEEELYSILMQRASLSLHENTYSDDVIRYISEISSSFGSARVAIELLQKSAYSAEYRGGEEISSDDIRAAKSMINPYLTESKLSELESDELVILLAVCQSLENSNSTDTSEVFERSASLFELYGREAIDLPFIYRTMKKLQTLGIVEGRVMGKGDRKGVEKRIMLSDVPVGVLANKIREILERL